MQNSKGFTIVELLIVVVVVVILGLITFNIVRSVSDPSYNYCENYKYSSMGDVPASCVDYFISGEGRR